MPKNLTSKQQKFTHAVIKTRANGEPDYKAAEEVYDVGSSDSAMTIASKNLTKPHIRAEIARLAEVEGLSYVLIIRGILEGTQALKQVSVAAGLINKLIKKSGVVEMPNADETTDDFIEVPDFPTRLGYLKLAAEILDMLPDKKAEITGLVGHAWLENFKEEFQIDEQSISSIREVDDDDVRSETLPISEGDNPENTPSPTD